MGLYDEKVKELLEVANKMDKFKEEHREEAAEVHMIMADAGATLCAGLTAKNPTLLLMASELASMNTVMFWLGYFTKATRVEVPEVYKAAMSGGPK